MSDATTRASFRFFHRLRVRWAEVDLQKIVFNPHYLMYVDTALADYWRALALLYEQSLRAMGGDLFVRKSILEFHASAVYDDVLDVGLRCARVGNSSLQMSTGFILNCQDICTGIAKAGQVTVGVNNHQMHVQRLFRYLLYSFNNRKPKRDIRNKQAIHNIEVNPVSLASVYH